MFLRPQNSRKQLLEREIASLEASRSALATEVNDLTVARERARSDFERDEASRRDRFDAFERECGERRSALLNEISSLEARKAEAMRPVTDRVKAVADELRRLGIRVTVRRDGLTVHPGQPSAGAVETYHDHRMAMSFAVTGLRTPGLRINDPGCVSKTFPDFWERFAQVHG